MVKSLHKVISIIGLCLFFTTSVFAQNTDSTNTNDDPVPTTMKGFHLGLQAGTYFANKYTCNLYDGYGVDMYGVRNDFAHSFMYQRIVNDYGGGNGQTDRIALALGVNPGQWSFNEIDMPINLKYNVALLVGLNTRYCFNNKSAIILNVNATKLTVNGNFTIETYANTGYQGATNVRTFSIVGGEQRLMSQLGFQQILGDNDKLNCFIEGGIDVTMAKYLRNQLIINNLTIDMSSYYYQSNYGSYRTKNLIGVGLGAFAGFGFNLTLGNKYIIQLVYNPSFDRINIGSSPKYTFQQSIGLRAYYNF